MKYKWHSWFAWYPVFISGKLYWLKTVQRIWDPDANLKLDSSGYGECEGGWAYKERK